MKNITEIFSNPVAKTLGWTLVHSLWQILAITLVYFLVILMTKKANTRYWAGMSLLAVQLLGSIATFFIISQMPAADKQVSVNALTPKILTWAQSALYYLQSNLHLIVGLWVVGCVLLFARLLMGYVWVNQIKNHPKNKNNEQLSAILDSLKSKMGIVQNVAIKTSSVVSLPMIMGVFKPVILMPIGLVTGFSQEQLETILAHELAHLKRHDFLFNGLQSVLDVLYFFHPAMWLLSAQIRKERENCCDDLALNFSGNKVLLARTLVQLQETAYAPKLALAFGKKSYSLLERVQRIVGVNQTKNFTKESVWIVVGLFVTFFALAQKNNQKEPEARVTVGKVEIGKVSSSDTLINPKKDESGIVIQNDKHDFRIKENKILFDGKEVELSPEVKVQVDQRLKAIEINKAQLEKQSKLMEEEGKKMEEYGNKMQLHSKPMEEVGKKMEVIGKQMELAAKKFEAEMRKKGLSEKEIEELDRKFGKQMAEYDVQMQVYSEQMDELSKQMDESSAPMDAISAKMDELSAPMDAISMELDNNVNAIIELLPHDIKSKISTDRPKAPRPPKAPKAPKSPKAMKSFPPPPPPPPAPRSRVSKPSSVDVAPPPPPPAPRTKKQFPPPPPPAPPKKD